MIALPTRSSIIWRRSSSAAARSYSTVISSSTSNSSNHHQAKILSTLQDHKLTASISLFINKAGSRHQPSHGIAHLLKNMVFKSTQKRSALSLIRETELLGGILTSSVTREHLILTAQFLKGNEGYFAEVLGDVLTSTKFTRHEFNEEALPGAIGEYHQVQRDPTIVALDEAHKLAFRKGVGHSLFVHPDVPVSHDSVVDFARQSFARSQDHTIVGAGIEAQRLQELVDQFFYPPSSSSSTSSSSSSSSSSGSSNLSAASSTKSTYHGGHSRITRGGSEATFLIGFQGSQAGAGGVKSHPEYTVLQHLLGSEPSSVKWSSGGSSVLAGQPVKAFHLNYSDIGLFGFLIRGAPAHQVKSIATKALSELKNVAQADQLVDQAAVDRAISKAKLSIATSLESNLAQNEILGTSISSAQSSTTTTKVPHHLEDLYASYSEVTPERVIEAAKSILNSHPTSVAIGNTDALPHFDELDGLR